MYSCFITTMAEPRAMRAMPGMADTPSASTIDKVPGPSSADRLRPNRMAGNDSSTSTTRMITPSSGR
ncbi:hypothetical protein G6F35_017001 [Rhizopus arrhizus]|nr:hypothetical protein G6F35_017001 [Rhizopus arrhizus]